MFGWKDSVDDTSGVSEQRVRPNLPVLSNLLRDLSEAVDPLAQCH
jgi:hypothetical protein